MIEQNWRSDFMISSQSYCTYMINSSCHLALCPVSNLQATIYSGDFLTNFTIERFVNKTGQSGVGSAAESAQCRRWLNLWTIYRTITSSANTAASILVVDTPGFQNPATCGRYDTQAPHAELYLGHMVEGTLAPLVKGFGSDCSQKFEHNFCYWEIMYSLVNLST
jgi:hypothetical protein